MLSTPSFSKFAAGLQTIAGVSWPVRMGARKQPRILHCVAAATSVQDDTSVTTQKVAVMTQIGAETNRSGRIVTYWETMAGLTVSRRPYGAAGPILRLTQDCVR